MENLVKWKITLERKGMLPDLQRLMPVAVSGAALLARAEWIKVARNNLRTSKDEYIRGIQQPKIIGDKVVITLEGWLPNAIEQGRTAFDMKPGFLGSSKARGSAGNTYFTVPFQLRSPGSAGGSPPVMPKTIYNLASKLKFGQRLDLPKKYEGYGLRSQLAKDAWMPTKAGGLRRTGSWGNYTWQNSPFQGIVRERRFPGELKTTPAGRMAQYKTFRRVSKRSDANSWIHPGFRPRNLLEKAVANWESQVSTLVNQILTS